MGWGLGFDDHWGRDIGYSVPAYCDHPGCGREIDRGLSYVCGGDAYGGGVGCGLFFCTDHLGLDQNYNQVCDRCLSGEDPYNKTSDHPDWVAHKETDESWSEWRRKRDEKKIKNG